MGIFFILLLSISLVYAANETDANVTIASDDEDSKIDKAYDCLKEKVDDECDSLSVEELIFTYLAIGECKSELMDNSDDDECWPDSNCNIKNTAQALLALESRGSSTTDVKEWLISQNSTPSDLYWYLQIESPEETSCEITYSDSTYVINIDEDKKLNGNAGSCLVISDNDYWLRIYSECYDEEFDVSCDEQFLTNLLFTKEDSSTIHVSDETHSSSAEGTTTEKVNSFCFSEGVSCDYEGSLWATLALGYIGEDVDPYIPYLIAMMDDNSEYLPESFLYYLTNSFRNELLLKQQSNSYWVASGDKFYDTAIALYPFQNEEPSEKKNTKEWLLEIQDDDGCWEGNIRNTAFLLHSIWPKKTSSGSSGGTSSIDCEDAGYYCMSSIKCSNAQGEELEYGGCFIPNICCSKPEFVETCSEQGGEICNSGQNCVGGRLADSASDISYGEKCCIGGTCEDPTTQPTCLANGGICEPIQCSDGYEISYLYDCESGDTCCLKSDEAKTSYWWIIILILLIIIVGLGILFRDKLRPYWMKLKSKFTKKDDKGDNGGRQVGTGRRPPGFPPAMPPFARRPMMRRPMPPARSPARKPSDNEVDDVLKKLKDISK